MSQHGVKKTIEKSGGSNYTTPVSTPRGSDGGGSVSTVGLQSGPVPPVMPAGLPEMMTTLMKQNQGELLASLNERFDKFEQGMLSKSEFTTYSQHVAVQFDGLQKNFATLESKVSEFEQKLASSDVSMIPPDVATLKEQLKPDLVAEMDRQIK